MTTTTIPALTEVFGRYVSTDEPGVSQGLYRVACRDCGDVATDVTIQQAGLHRTRHLTQHLATLADEMREAAR